FSLAEDSDDLFVGKTLLHGDVLMWLMKTLLTSRCINQRGAGQINSTRHCWWPATGQMMGYTASCYWLDHHFLKTCRLFLLA
ncbi:hypothetical protein L4N02_28920, partial [Klebsiella variicola]|uniref:hypothetical protein n=1 Tax=Klebsiella variicola TaxID=244366 RepID=UPI001F393461